MIRNRGLRVIYVFSTDLDALFHVNYGKVPSFKSQALLGNGSSEILPCYVQLRGKSRVCLKGSFCINMLSLAAVVSVYPLQS